MMATIFPLQSLGSEASLLTAIVLGFLFGFSLERAGFGNARKLAAQFYLRDMTVFKVMFTAILVAMVGVYSFHAIGWVDLEAMWINPTFMWAQAAGGFLLGVGFILSGLCPGTSVVSAASGRIDGFVVIAGIFVGTFAFTLLIDFLPGLERLYQAGDQGVSILPRLLGVPPAWLALGVVLMAGAAFLGVEGLERRFRGESEALGTSATASPAARHVQVALAGGLAIVVLLAGLAPLWLPQTTRADAEAMPPSIELIEPLGLAEALIAGHEELVILDTRTKEQYEALHVPRAIHASSDDTTALATTREFTTIVVCTEDGTVQLPDAWPRDRRYRFLRGGIRAWQREVLTPVQIDPAQAATTVDDVAFVTKQNEIAAYFSGVRTQPTVQAPPPPPPAATGSKKKKRAAGC
ncbi:MAG: YeeE/YedE family protein [Candidatus Latescibacterota bacterium]|nr:MAG: YeeE/YedE family protein [Candidatus Latescibacterota bacterium]